MGRWDEKGAIKFPNSSSDYVRVDEDRTNRNAANASTHALTHELGAKGHLKMYDKLCVQGAGN